MKEKSGIVHDQHLDRSILVMLSVLRKTITTKTRDLTGKSLVEHSSGDVNDIHYIALCVDIAEQEFKQLANRTTD